MTEKSIAGTVEHDSTDGCTSTDFTEQSTSSSPARAFLDGHTEDLLQAINQLIDNLEAATQKQLEAKDAELDDLKEEAERTLHQLQAAQSQLEDLEAATQKQLEAKDAELDDLKEEAELILRQLHQVQEELEIIFLDRQKKVSGYRDLLLNYHENWMKEQSSGRHLAAICKKILSLTYAKT